MNKSIEELTTTLDKLEEKYRILEDKLNSLLKSANANYITCPKCGSDLEADTTFVLACYPPKYQIRCCNKNCDYHDCVGKDKLNSIKYRREIQVLC